LTRRLVIDANVIGRVFLPSEEKQGAQEVVEDFALGRVELLAPSLLPYEITNAVLNVMRQAKRKDLLTEERALEILEGVHKLRLPLRDVAIKRIFRVARMYRRSAYDAAYLALAEEEGIPFITGDKRLYNAVKDRLPWVEWVEGYRSVGAEAEE